MTYRTIKEELNLHMDQISFYKNDFMATVDAGNPSFPKYLVLFRFLQNLLLNIRFRKVCCIQNFEIYFSDINNRVLFISRITLDGNTVNNNLVNLTDEDVRRYFEGYLNNSLKILNQIQRDFLDYVNFTKTTNWICLRRQNNIVLSARYTPGSAVIEQLRRA
uniref:Uncharacterized protein n=1 Tax=viral metagenome TaxID=1070528 RepID=A0A6C0ADG8_9ZZZZ